MMLAESVKEISGVKFMGFDVIYGTPADMREAIVRGECIYRDRNVVVYQFDRRLYIWSRDDLASQQ